MYDYRKTRVVLDIECYVNYFLIAIHDIDSDRSQYFEMRGDGDELNLEKLRRTLRGCTIITFNGNKYDVPMICLALHNVTCSELKFASDSIITRNLQPWEFYQEFECDKPAYIDHIDMFELPKGKHSLKNYAARIGARKLQDLPYEPSRTLSDKEMDNVRDYCFNDLDETILLFKVLEKAIDVRIALANQYKMDVRSKSDGQLAEAILVRLVESKHGVKVSKPKSSSYSRGFTYTPPECISFKNEKLIELLDIVKQSRYHVNEANGNIILPVVLDNLVIPIGENTYKFGGGGLHSQESKVSRYADDEMVLMDIDVGSFYPSLIIMMGLYPKQLGKYFLELFTSFKNDRISLKHGKTSDIAPLWLPLIDKSDVKASSALIVSILKIFLNATFGKMGSIFSKIFAPELLIKITITGQLMLLMLIEAFESRGIRVVSANTDGIVLYTKRRNLPKVKGIVAAWEVNTTMEMEYTEYKSIHSRDVNSYIAFTNDGKVKRKGNFAERGLDTTGNNQVSIDAVIEYIRNGTPLIETIKSCRDILKFTNFTQVSGGGMKDGVVLGRVVRWYYSTEVKGTIQRVKTGATVAMTQGARPCMEIPVEFPDDVDYMWYEREARHMLSELGIDHDFDDAPTGDFEMMCRPSQKTTHYVDIGSGVAACGAKLKDRHDQWETSKPEYRICGACKKAVK